MISKEQEKLIKETAREMFDKMGFQTKLIVTTSVSEDSSDKTNVTLEIDSPDSKFIIGKHGTTLVAIQHILKLLVRSKADEHINFSVDVNGYRRQQDDYIRNLAREVAQEVVINGRASTLEPMNGYERRLVHLELEKNDLVKTESIGEGEDRKVIISPSGE
jgi:spoIIIJ-associated protein